MGILSNKNPLILLVLISTTASAYATLGPMGRTDPKQINDGNRFSRGVYASRDTYGMRANAVVAAIRANSEGSFDYPVLGFNYLKEMSEYHDRDSVGLYADNTSLPLKAWERVNNVTYSPVSFSAKGIDSSKIKVGMIIDTDHNPKWSSYIIRVSEGKVITAGWVNTVTGRMGTPPNGVGLTINPITKVWATNFNIFLREGGRANSGVIQENGIVNNSIKNPTAVNGLDTVILPQSKYGGTAAYLARVANSGNKQQWKYGFMSQGSYINFISYDSTKHSPEMGFVESSSAKNGMVFAGRNTESSLLWKNGGRVLASIDPQGLIQKIGYKTVVVRNDINLSEMIGRYIISSPGKITLTLPPKKLIFDGYTMKLTKVAGSDVTLKSQDGVNINGETSTTIIGVSWNKEAIYMEGEWFIQ
ncbi:hypothetical protein H0251_00780 [Pectobacterium carotovorum]|uniref:hypothetical protein n=1 Tax=Pectobacterium carotovorum TaxID=554 RepID=UPI0015DDF778|nr:hypothetical protein [Pectobacterium carotovorum]MBA0178166.1 hypothetical protein [Pectobacterium carotovorum]